MTGKGSFVSPDENYVGYSREYRGETEELVANRWTVVFKQVFHFQDKTRAYLRFSAEMPASLTSEIDMTLFRNSFKMRIINNDTRQEFNPVRTEPMTQTFEPNKSGYTIMVESICEKTMPKSRWGINVLSKPEFPVAHAGEGEVGRMDKLALACEVNLPVQPKKYNVLFRCVATMMDYWS